ncbi:TPA: hypothetical protein MDT29_000878 [Klebsiella pneumoniae]|nr:hypothetical protein [Klebsiella pneumoniae]HBV3020939.1 hypothetical protein [Klebsiella pneumoniae]HBV3057519.1 hypothetical protein [Klebsiella pneumoniae]
MYRIYIRNFDQQVLVMHRTTSPEEAKNRFEELVSSTEYDGQKVGVALTKDGKQIAFHRFDKAPGHPNYWRDRIDELKVSPGRGRPTTIGFVRKNISISPELWEVARTIGDGNASAGISAALAAYDKIKN